MYESGNRFVLLRFEMISLTHIIFMRHIVVGVSLPHQSEKWESFKRCVFTKHVFAGIPVKKKVVTMKRAASSIRACHVTKILFTVHFKNALRHFLSRFILLLHFIEIWNTEHLNIHLSHYRRIYVYAKESVIRLIFGCFFFFSLNIFFPKSHVHTFCWSNGDSHILLHAQTGATPTIAHTCTFEHYTRVD